MVHGDQTPVETPFGDGRRRSCLGQRGQFVERRTGDALHRSDCICRHALVGLGIDGPQVHVAAVDHATGNHRPVGAIRGHHLRASGHHDVFHAGHHLGCRQAGGGDARTAVPVEGYATGPKVVAGIHCGHAAEVAALGAHLHARAPDDVIDVARLEVVALRQCTQHCRTE